MTLCSKVDEAKSIRDLGETVLGSVFYLGVLGVGSLKHMCDAFFL